MDDVTRGNSPQGGERKALYQVVIDDLLARIRDNDYSFDKPFCTEQSLMDQYGISRITAKRAITDLESRGMLVRKRRLGSFVSRNVLVREVEGPAPMQHFAFVLPFDITKGGLIDTFRTANTLLNDAGYGMTIHITDVGTASRDRSVFQRLMGAELSGLVYYPSTNDIHLELLNHFVMANKPIVIMDIASDCPYLHGVTSDNYTGSRLLTEHLVSLGHRRIGYLTGFPPEKRTTIRDRFGGYLQVLRDSQILPDPALIITNLGLDYRIPVGTDALSTPLHAALRTMLEAGATAIETENDELAFYAVMAAREMGIRVPEQLSLCGFDHSESAQRISGGITTVAQDFEQIGREIAGILLASLGDAGLAPRKIVVPTRLVIQGTTAPPAR